MNTQKVNMQRSTWEAPRMSPSRASTDPNEGKLVTKLLSKLKESQDLFDNLETLFDHKVKELGSTESDLQKAANQITNLHQIIAHKPADKSAEISATPARQLTSPPHVSAFTSPAPLPASVAPMPVATSIPLTTGSGAVEVNILQERIRQMQLDHANQMRMHTENINSQVNARVQEEVTQRMAQHNTVIERLKLECATHREEAYRRVAEQQADIERLREHSLRTEEESREAMLRREASLAEQVEMRFKEEVKVRDSQIQAQKIEVDRARMDIEEKNADIQRKQASLAIANETVIELKEQHTQAIEALEMFTIRHQSVANECARIQSQYDVVVDGKAQLGKEYDALQEAYDHQTVAARQAKEECDRKKEAVEKLRTELATLRRQITELQGVTESKSSTIAKLQIEVSTLQSRYDDQVSKQERQLRNQERQHLSQLEEGKNVFGEEKKSYINKALSLQNKIDEMAQHQEVHEQTVQQLGATIKKSTELELKCQEKDRENTVLLERTKQVEELMMKLNASEVKEMTLDERIRELHVSLAEKDRELNAAILRLKSAEDLRMQLQSAEVRGASLHEREKEAHERLRQKEIELSAATEKIRTMDELKTKLREELATLRAHNETLRDKEEQGKARDKELSLCRDEMNKAILELNRRNDELRTLKVQVAEIQLLREGSAKLEEVKSLLAAKDHKVEALTKEIAQAQLLNEQKDKEYEALAQDYDVKEEECLKQAAHLDAAENELRDFVRTKADLEMSSAKIEEMQKLFELKEHSLQERAQEVTAGCEQIVEEQEKLVSKITALEEQLTESQRENEHLKGLNRHKDFMMNEKEKDLDGSHAKEAQLREWVHNTVAEVTEKAEEAKNDCRHYQDQLTVMTTKLSHREQQNLELSESNDKLRDALQTATNSEGPLQAENQLIKSNLNMSQAALESTKEELRDETAKVQQHTAKIQQLMKQQEESRASLANYASEKIKYSQLHASHDNLNKQNTQLQQQLRDAQGEASSTARKLEMAVTVQLETAKELEAAKEAVLQHEVKEAMLQNEVREAALQHEASLVAQAATQELREADADPTPAPLPAPVPVQLTKEALENIPCPGDNIHGVEMTDDESLKLTTSATVPTIGLQLDEDGKHGSAVRIGDVKNAGLAYQAGMRKGDFLKSVNNRPIDSSKGMEKVLGQCEPGQEIYVEFVKVKGKAEETFHKAIQLGRNSGRGMGSKKSSVASSIHKLSRTGSRRSARPVSRPGTNPPSAVSTPVQSSLNLSSHQMPKNWQ